MLGQLTRQDETDTVARMLATRQRGDDDSKGDSRGLDLSGRDGGLLVVGSELRGLGGDTLEDVVDERVQDGHGTVRDTSVGVDLLEDCCDVWGQHVLGLGGARSRVGVERAAPQPRNATHAMRKDAS